MKDIKQTAPNTEKPLSTSDVGRYLKRLAVLNRDKKTGNIALSDALHELASVLLSTKGETFKQILETSNYQGTQNLRADLQTYGNELSLPHILELLQQTDIKKHDLVAIGRERFGIPESKLMKMPRGDLVDAIRSATQHEQSIEILSDEAKVGGRKRTS